MQSVWKTFLGFDPVRRHQCRELLYGHQGREQERLCRPGRDRPERGRPNRSPGVHRGPGRRSARTTRPGSAGGAATNNTIKADAIYFFSFGDYAASCKTNNKGLNCGGSRLASGTTNAIEAVNGVVPNETNILDGQFPVDHYLYNVYSDGSNANIPAATAATLNYASEVGFICNPNKGGTTMVVDPNTGIPYLTEEQNLILGSGFFPLSAGAASGTVTQAPVDEGTVANPASHLLGLTSGGGQGAGQPATDPGYAQYKPFDTFATTGPNSDPAGYCADLRSTDRRQRHQLGGTESQGRGHPGRTGGDRDPVPTGLDPGPVPARFAERSPRVYQVHHQNGFYSIMLDMQQ